MSSSRTERTSLPTGTVTFVFTDIEGSTALWDAHPSAMRPRLDAHFRQLEACIRAHRGHIVKTMGDGVMAVFRSAVDAVAACVSAQREFQCNEGRSGYMDGDGSNLELRVRMGVHTGEANVQGNDYFGNALNVASRVMSVACGEQILVSGVTADIVRNSLSPATSLRPLGEHRLKGIAHAVALLQVDVPGLRSEFPPLPVRSESDALPTPATTFVGREAEIRECLALLERARVLTLSGLGGSGKTRLAIEVAARTSAPDGNGVHFIDLAPVMAGGRVAISVATSLGVREVASASVVDALCEQLAVRSMLLVLDNCEQVVAACSALVEALVHRTRGVRILATSREPLRVTGEQVFGVASLGLARRAYDDGEPMSEAARLFVARARLVDSRFAPSGNALKSVEAICHRLEGIPLAIELAAARIKVLQLGDIEDKLSKPLTLLKSSSRSETRHQTLRGVIEWSDMQLSPEQRVALQRLSVFSGGWTLIAAAGVLDCDEFAAIDQLEGLVDKSLVTLERRDTHVRYRMLETVREYAAEKLADAGSTEDAREAHFRFFHGVARFMRSKRDGAFDANVGRLISEFDNVMAAYDWCRARHGFEEAGLTLAVALARVLVDRAQPRAALALLRDAMAVFGGRSRGSALGDAMVVAGDVELDLGNVDAAQRLLEDATDLARTLGDEVLMVRALVRLGATFFERNLSEAHRYTEEALSRARVAGADFEIGAALIQLGELARMERRHDEARQHYLEALALFQDKALDPTIPFFNLAIVANEQCDFRSAIDYLSQACRQAIRRNSEYYKCWVPHHGAALAAALDEATLAARLWGAAASARDATGITLQTPDIAFFDQRLQRSRDALGETLFNASFDAGRTLSIDEAVAELDAWLQHAAPKNAPLRGTAEA